MSEKNGSIPIAELRKNLARATRTLEKAALDRHQLQRAIEEIENRCVHNWSRNQLVKGTQDQFYRECSICGKTQKSKDVKVKFD